VSEGASPSVIESLGAVAHMLIDAEFNELLIGELCCASDAAEDDRECAHNSDGATEVDA
jgi:hypothetical protein